MDNVQDLPLYPLGQHRQIVTVQDLVTFKVQLIQEIRQLLTAQTADSDFKKWVKSLEVQKLLNISRGKLFSLRTSGRLPFTRIGGVIYYNREDISQMMEENKQQRA